MTKETHCWGLSALTRHSLRNADAEIAHLEKALAADGTHSIFAQTYWRRCPYERLLTVLECYEKQYG